MTRFAAKRLRHGVAIVLLVLLAVPLIAMVALAVDYGYLLKVRNDLQRAADMTALAAVRDLVPAADGSQRPNDVIATAKSYAAENFDGSFTLLDADVKMGRYDPATIYSQVNLLNTGVWDTVRVTLRRDATANSPVSLFFAPVMGINASDVSATATAVLQKPQYLSPGANVLAFAVLKAEWDSLAPGDEWTIYGDGKVEDDDGDAVPGNWGTVDIGDENNSTSDLGDQIANGLRQSDLDALYSDGRIAQDTHIDPAAPVSLQADPGLSSGLKHAVQAIHGQDRIIPLYEELADDDDSGPSGGNNLEYKIIGWGVVNVVDSRWGGAKNTYIKVQKAYLYDSNLSPHPDLSNTSAVLPGMYTSSVLVE